MGATALARAPHAASSITVSAQTSRMSVTSAGEYSSLPISASRHATAHRSGTRPSSPAWPARVARPARRVEVAGAQCAAARTTRDLTRCRTEPRARRPGATARSAWAGAGRRRMPSPVRRTPTPAASAAGARGGGDKVRRRAAAPAADAANRPTPSASAAKPMSASAPASAVPPDQRQRPAVPARGPGHASRAGAGRTPRVLCASDASRPRGEAASARSRSAWAAA